MGYAEVAASRGRTGSGTWFLGALAADGTRGEVLDCQLFGPTAPQLHPFGRGVGQVRALHNIVFSCSAYIKFDCISICPHYQFDLTQSGNLSRRFLIELQYHTTANHTTERKSKYLYH